MLIQTSAVYKYVKYKKHKFELTQVKIWFNLYKPSQDMRKNQEYNLNLILNFKSSVFFSAYFIFSFN
jgi:hypothetical protein